MKDFKQIINENIKKKKNFVFVSPHFDDAVYSAGGLIYYLSSRKAKVEIINVFTKADKSPYTLSTKRNLHMSGFSDAQKLYKEREIEDSAVLGKLNVKIHNLGFIEALYRRKTRVKKSLLGRLLPEAEHIYPTYRGHIIRGVVSGEDIILTTKIKKKIEKIIDKRRTVVFCPLANSLHVDHEIVKKVCGDIFDEVFYWEDFPYNLNAGKNVKKSRYSKVYSFRSCQKQRLELIKGYKTQFRSTFKRGKVDLIPERYYLKMNK